MYEEILGLYIETRSVPFTEDDLEGYISEVVRRTNTYMDYFGLLLTIRFHIKPILRQVLSRRCSVQYSKILLNPRE